MKMGSTPFTSPTIHRAEGLPYFTPANNAGAAVNQQDPNTPTLFRPLQIRDVTLKNRVIVAPMCTYSTESDPTSPAVGALTDFHIAHLGHLATKGAGLIFIEATSIQPNGRISPNDSGLWQDGTDSEQFKGLRRVVDFVHSQGARIGIQLAHAGRKASTVAPWLAAQAKQRGIKADESVGGWPSNVVGPSGGEEQIWAPGDQFWAPRELETVEVEELVRAFARSAELAAQAGVDVIEIHGAHGYLIHQFLSPITNRRTDKYGGSFENRTRLLSEVATAIRAVVPSGMPLFLRISATDWLENQAVAARTGSWDMPSSIQLTKLLPDLGLTSWMSVQAVITKANVSSLIRTIRLISLAKFVKKSTLLSIRRWLERLASLQRLSPLAILFRVQKKRHRRPRQFCLATGLRPMPC